MKMHFKISALVALSLGLTFPVSAAEFWLRAESFTTVLPSGEESAIQVMGASFELPDCDVAGACNSSAPQGDWNAGGIQDWVVTGSAGAFAPVPAILAVQDGDQVAYANAGGVIAQNTGEIIAAGMSYRLTVDIGDRTDGPAAGPNYRIALYAMPSGTLLGDDTTSAAPIDGFETASVTAYAPDAVAGETLEIRLSNLPGGAQAEFDNVKLAAIENTLAVTMWGYASCGPTYGATCGAVTSPGPELVVPPGDTTLTVNLQNGLDEDTSVYIPSLNKSLDPVMATTDATSRLRVTSFDSVVAPNADGAYVWTDVSAGSYVYQSGTHVQKQVQMGLYGVVTKDAACAGSCAYSDVEYDVAQTVVFSEVDPNLHDEPAAANATVEGYVPTYFFINGGLSSGTGSVEVLNSGFEDPDCDVAPCVAHPKGPYQTSAASWAIAGGNGGVFEPLPSVIVPTQGDQVGWTAGGTLSQTTGNLLTAGITYTLDLDVGDRSDNVFRGYDVGLYAGGVLLANEVNIAAPVSGFASVSVAFTPPPGHPQLGLPVEIRLAPTAASGQTMFDNVSLNAGSDALVTAGVGDRILLRLVNAGLRNLAPQLLGGYFEVVGEDGSRVPVNRIQHTTLLPAQKALDVVFTPTAAGIYTLYDRRMSLENGNGSRTGMLTRIVVE